MKCSQNIVMNVRPGKNKSKGACHGSLKTLNSELVRWNYFKDVIVQRAYGRAETKH